jgi:hypothetical protein
VADYSDYLGIGVDEFWAKVRRACNRALFDIEGESIRPRFTVGVGL